MHKEQQHKKKHVSELFKRDFCPSKHTSPITFPLPHYLFLSLGMAIRKRKVLFVRKDRLVLLRLLMLLPQLERETFTVRGMLRDENEATGN